MNPAISSSGAVGAAELGAIGAALYGSLWQAELGRALGVNVRTVRRWASGERRVGPAVVRALAALVRRRGAALAAIADQLEPPAPPD